MHKMEIYLRTVEGVTNSKLRLLLFADDLVLLSDSESTHDLQVAVDFKSDYCMCYVDP